MKISEYIYQTPINVSGGLTGYVEDDGAGREEVKEELERMQNRCLQNSDSEMVRKRTRRDRIGGGHTDIPKCRNANDKLK